VIKHETRNSKGARAEFNRLTFCLLAWSFFLIIVCFSATARAGWRKQNSGTLAWLRGIYFIGESEGFVVGGGGTILHTTNGGATWGKIPKFTEDNLRDIAFFDSKNGWILAERDLLKTREGEARSYLLKTSDGGATWRKVEFQNNNSNAVLTRFVISADKRKIWAIGEIGTLYQIESGEQSVWQKQTPPTKYLLTGGAIVSDAKSWLVGAGGTMVFTSDGGKIWRESKLPANDKIRLNAIFFPQTRRGVAIGTGGSIFLSETAGANWRKIDSETNADLLDLFFVDNQTGWICGDGGTLLTTANGGATWTQEKSIGATIHRFERIFFASPARGWVVGFGGSIYHFVNL
jgi:photosystem II stability/assembly factor-like uncharacterized protein